jgi:hypothetical protein
MNPAVENKDASYWLFELEDDGTVLHSSPYPAEAADPSMRSIVGLNFFEEVSGFEDISEMRRRFRSFLRGGKAFESICMNCFAEGELMQSKVVMTRAYKTGCESPAEVVMLEIRQDKKQRSKWG